jgi:hypothetical protein
MLLSIIWAPGGIPWGKAEVGPEIIYQITPKIISERQGFG